METREDRMVEWDPRATVRRNVDRPLMLFSGRGNPELSRRIAEKLGTKLGRVTTKTFADGEIYVKYEDSVRGADLFIVQPTCRPVNENLMELLIMIQAAKLASAHRVIAVIPWFGYSRQDKKSQPREPITGRLVADLLEAAGADRVLTMDLHAGQLQGFFKVPVDHMTAIPMLSDYFKYKELKDVVVISPDAGGVKMAKRTADRLGATLAVLTKLRPDHNVARVMHVIGDVKGKTAIIVDDIIDTAGTLVNGVEILLDRGAVEVYAAATHPVLSGPAYDRIAGSGLRELVVTDTIPLRADATKDKIVVLSTAGILADTIHNVFADESVSALFQGDNQLF
jgi:ribose-phosphate pyrophosphokinase